MPAVLGRARLGGTSAIARQCDGLELMPDAYGCQAEVWSEDSRKRKGMIMVDQAVVATATLAVDWGNTFSQLGGALGKGFLVVVVVGVGGALIDAAARYIKNRFM